MPILRRRRRIVRGNRIHVLVEVSSCIRGIRVFKHTDGVYCNLVVLELFRRIDSSGSDRACKAIIARLTVGEQNNNLFRVAHHTIQHILCSGQSIVRLRAAISSKFIHTVFQNLRTRAHRS